MTILHTSDGVDLHYLSCSSKNSTASPVIFLHGWCSNAIEWHPFAESLASNQLAICWNARGHGKHKISEATDMSLDRMSDDLHELISKEAPEGTIVVAHSMGALTAWRYIGKYGCDKIKGLVIVDQSPKLITNDQWDYGVFGDFDENANRQFCDHLDQDFSETVVRLICAKLDKSKDNIPDTNYFQRLREYLSLLPAKKLTECWQSLCDADLRPALAMVKAPTLLIYGDRSQFYSPELSRWVHRHIKDSQLIRYSEADHSPHIADRDRFISDLNSFINQINHSHHNMEYSIHG